MSIEDSSTPLGREIYRPDIDGLRAVAVLGVVAYHFGFINGGYVGVDIFFVISGYLITRILAGQLEGGNFGITNLARFYERRIRRISPALTAVCIVSAIVAFAILFPDDLKEFGQSLQSVAGFISNFHFSRKTGYFGGTADEKPLLHTWSLAVEEQYYLLFPLALWAIWHYGGRRAALAACLITIAASLFYAEVLVNASPSVAFYSTPSRIWELLTGASLALASASMPSRAIVREAMAAAGVLLIAAVYLLFSQETEFPGLSAALPVSGAALLIAAGERGTPLVSRLIATRILVGIGLISYSVYLWHWPLLVFAKYRLGPLFEEHASVMPALLVAASLAAGFVSWRFVEQPFRRPGLPEDRQRVFAIQAAVTILMLSTGIIYSRMGGLPFRFPAEVNNLLNPKASWSEETQPTCVAAEPALFKNEITVCRAALASTPPDRSILVWGDSHARVLKLPLARQVPANEELVTIVKPGCPPVAGVALGGRSDSARCLEHNDKVLKYLSERRRPISTVVLVARWAYYAEGTRMRFESGQGVALGENSSKPASRILEEQLTATVESVLKYVDKVVLLAPLPEFDRPVATSMAKSLSWKNPNLERPTRVEVNLRQASALAALARARSVDPARVTILSPIDYFCGPDYCDYADDKGRPFFQDTNHLNELGLERIEPFLVDIAGQGEKGSGPQ